MGSRIVLVIVFAMSILLYLALRSRNSAIRKNIQPTTGKTIRTVCMIIMIVVGLFIIRFVLLSLRSEGEGALFSPEKQETSAGMPETVEEASTVIHVTGQVISVDGSLVENTAELEASISQTAKDGGKFVLVDDYAENTTYLAVKSTLQSLGVSGDHLEEVKNQ